MSGLNLTVMRIQLRQELGVDSSDLPDDTDEVAEKIGANTLLNESYWELLDKYPFREKESSGTFVTIIGTRTYKIPTDFEALRMVSIEDPDSFQHTPLDRETVREYETQYANTDDAHGKPVWYHREGTSLGLRPTPDQEYTIVFKFWSTLADLSTSNPDPPLPRSFHEIVRYGALWRGFILFGDHARAHSIKTGIYASLLSTFVPTEAKEETDTHLGGVEVAGLDGEL